MKILILGLLLSLSSLALAEKNGVKDLGECNIKVESENSSFLEPSTKIFSKEITREACYQGAVNNALANNAEKVVVTFKKIKEVQEKAIFDGDRETKSKAHVPTNSQESSSKASHQ